MNRNNTYDNLMCHETDSKSKNSVTQYCSMFILFENIVLFKKVYCLPISIYDAVSQFNDGANY